MLAASLRVDAPHLPGSRDLLESAHNDHSAGTFGNSFHDDSRRTPSPLAKGPHRFAWASIVKLVDFFIAKPGPGSISEALVMGLALIVERNSWTLVQERFNTEWIVRKQL